MGYPELSLVKNEIESEINAYVDSVILLSSMKDRLQETGIKSFVEAKITKPDGTYKTPDLLIVSGNYILVDHKFTSSKDERTLSSKIQEMKEYEVPFVFSKGNPPKQIICTPEVVMLTPEQAAQSFKKLPDCPVTWGYVIEESITIEPSIGSVKDAQISAFFNPLWTCPASKDVAKFKFVLSHPPLPYTAYQVYSLLWNLISPAEIFAHEFSVKHEDILALFNAFFPPWIRPEAKQLTPTILDEALELLQKVGWIRWYTREKRILVSKSKGRYVPDLLSYLTDFYVKMEHERRVKVFERQAEELKRAETGITQTRMSDFL